MRWKTHFSSSDQASPSLSHFGLFRQPIFHSSTSSGTWNPSPSLPSDVITCKAMSAHFLRISGEEGAGRMPGGAEGLTVRRNRRLLLNQEERRARDATRTTLARSTPWMLCVNTHYQSDPSRAKRPPRSP